MSGGSHLIRLQRGSRRRRKKQRSSETVLLFPGVNLTKKEKRPIQSVRVSVSLPFLSVHRLSLQVCSVCRIVYASVGVHSDICLGLPDRPLVWRGLSLKLRDPGSSLSCQCVFHVPPAPYHQSVLQRKRQRRPPPNTHTLTTG